MTATQRTREARGSGEGFVWDRHAELTARTRAGRQHIPDSLTCGSCRPFSEFAPRGDPEHRERCSVQNWKTDFACVTLEFRGEEVQVDFLTPVVCHSSSSLTMEGWMLAGWWSWTLAGHISGFVLSLELRTPSANQFFQVPFEPLGCARLGGSACLKYGFFFFFSDEVANLPCVQPRTVAHAGCELFWASACKDWQFSVRAIPP